jgi:hypothetical protein
MQYRFVFLALAACSMDSIPSGLRPTPAGPGAMVIFDTIAQPLPNIPLPNDVATFADPTSRTGRRINASLVAPTAMERIARQGFDDIEGWGTYAPITVSFQRADGADPHKPALDLDDVMNRMKGDGYRFENDPVYLVNLTTGIPMVLDMGNGNFTSALRDPQRYWPNDPHVATSNLLYEANEEGVGLLQGDYKPSLDQDFDGVLDHPNTWGPSGQIPGVDDLLSWYERETDTLIMRPVLPLEEMAEYAVVLTDRLRGSDGAPVKSPFPFVHHPSQTDSVRRLQVVLQKGELANYYGDIAGTGLDHVAFAWTFTTQPVIEDMRLLRDGLYGKGPFGYFADQFPAKVTVLPAVGKVSGDPSQQPAGWKTDPACAPHAAHPYIFDPNAPDILKALQDLYSQVFGYDKGDIKALNEANSLIDHVVIGTYQSPYLQGDPKGNDPDARFHLNFQTGAGDVRSDTVQFLLVIPKQSDTYKQPFPVSLFGHGVGGNKEEGLQHGGNYARNGVAMIVINMPQQGLPSDGSVRVPATADLAPLCLTPLVDAFLATRALDRNGDGFTDPGWWWWTSHITNVRDNVRQGTLDEMQLTRILRTFDGKTMSGQDFNDDGKEDLAGDFDGDGIVDVGGAQNIYAAGESLGGIMSEIQGGIDHQLTATVPMSGGGGLTNIGYRSYGVTESFGQLFGPLLIGVPASLYPPKTSNGQTTKQTNCDASQISVRIFAEDGDDIPQTEIACLSSSEAAPNKTVVLTNLSQTIGQTAHCARTGGDGSFRIEFGATYLDDLDVQFYLEADAVDSYKTCNVDPSAHAGRHISTFEQPAPAYHVTVDTSCPTASCAQFMDRFFPVGSQLAAVQDGLGFKRNAPDARRFWFLAQIGVDPADPINFAPYYMMRPLPDPDGKPTKPRALLGANTVGDSFVNIETGMNFARAAGAIPFFPPDALSRYPEYADYVTPQPLYDAFGGKTPNQVFIENYEVEGVYRFGRRPAGPNCGVNYDSTTDPVTCSQNPQPDPATCTNTLYDADWMSEGKNRYDAQHPQQPVRLARVAGLHVDPANPKTLLDAWRPRLMGVPFSSDVGAWDASAMVVGVMNIYIKPQGQHTWDVVDACKIWDDAEYGGNMTAHFFRSGGTDPYYLSHPATHECLESLDCPFFTKP